MRDAKNGREFVAEAKRLADFDIQVIGGAHEARLIQEGIWLNHPEMPSETCLTMDIGGGSVEFVIWKGHEIQWAQSFNTGVARLHMLMGLPDPMGREGQANMTPYFDDVMAPLVAAVAALKPTRLVGASGSFDTLAEMAGTRTKRERPDHAQTPESHPCVDPIPMEAFQSLAEQLVEQDVHHRVAMPGMDPARVDLMPFSVALIEWVLGLGDFKDMVRAPYALREGVMTRLERGLPLLPELG
jgi:exopolyphosphatase/guanosine-5'-triphosphate,3'-diphosphate pyrophosphatase